ncbi:Hypothetical predicted protein [Podarcis lilfordi]|uniref:Uncharacterized protein n=1 Tax=Podarcis lilfordi TaxID=74358 RepID=A0AA35P4B2_9SAUR|nr:Hypothetical predicted protein [Podarcis lilfordi]
MKGHHQSWKEAAQSTNGWQREKGGPKCYGFKSSSPKEREALPAVKGLLYLVFLGQPCPSWRGRRPLGGSSKHQGVPEEEQNRRKGISHQYFTSFFLQPHFQRETIPTSFEAGCDSSSRKDHLPPSMPPWKDALRDVTMSMGCRGWKGKKRWLTIGTQEADVYRGRALIHLVKR